MRISAIILFHFLCTSAWTSEPPLNRLGQPFANANCEIIWAVTNTLPEALWLYRVQPTTFAPNVISNLIALGEFTEKDRVADLGWPLNDPSRMCFSNDKRSLGIYPHLGFIEYRYPKANDYQTEEGVPTEEESLRLGIKWAGLLDLDRSQVSQIGVNTPLHLKFRHDPYRVITNVNSRSVGFGRRLDGIAFYNKAEGCKIEFAHHAVVRDINLSWRNLRRDRLRAVAKPEELIQWMREGKAFWQWWSPEAQAYNSSVFKRVTVKRVTPYYYEEDREKPQEVVYPFAYLETAVDMTITNTIVPPGEVRFNIPDITNVFKLVVQNITNQTVFMCCPMIDDKGARK